MLRFEEKAPGRAAWTRTLWNCNAVAAALMLVMACGSDDGRDDDDVDRGPASGEQPSQPDAARTSSADAGSPDAYTPNLTPGRCESGSLDACSSFVTTFGLDIKLGKHGAIMEPNVGTAFKNQVSPLDTPAACQIFASIFGQDPAQTARLLDTMQLDLSLYTVYRPVKLDGEKLPIVIWGNGTCAQPEGYAALLRYVASQGFFVVAPNSRYVATGMAQVRAIDFAFAANDDPQSPYYQKLDTSRVAAMGHSQGGGATVTTASDPRVKTVILFNGGMNPPKPYLTISGDRDLGNRTASAMNMEVQAAPKAAYLFYHMIPGTGMADGHLTLMTQPERVMEPTVAWLKFMLLDDAESRAFFVGDTCKLCGKEAEFEYGQKGL